MIILRYILFPVVPIYYLVTWLRNRFYDLGIFESKSYNLPLICVGNLSVGGTGKSPMIEYLIRLLKDEKHIATLSRGYKRNSTGYYLADENATAKTLGDEPFQFYKKFKNHIKVAVDADRQNGIQRLMQHEICPEVILLDDAFQHRKVNAGLNILLSTYDNLYTHDWVLPTGNLREPRSGADRAQIIVVSKCPSNLNASEKGQIIKKIKPKDDQNVFFSSIQYDTRVFSEVKSLNLDALDKFTLVTGIANPKPLLNHLKSQGLDFEHFNFPDHYNFTKKDIELFARRSVILTTEKDYVRLYQNRELKNNLYYLPIGVSIDENNRFDALIKDFTTA